MNSAKPLLNAVLLLSLVFPICISLDTITPDQPIKDGQTLLSNQKTFALGFFSPDNSNRRYVGIWYYQITEQTVVWVANKDNPLNDTSGVLSINDHGNLILHSQNRTTPIWSANVSVSVSPTNNSMAQLLDSGNLVLVQQDNQRVKLWQSFDYPTNTMLPLMKLGLNRRTGLNKYLTSWKSKDDMGTNNYSLGLDPSGYPQFFFYMNWVPLWRIGSWTGQGLGGVPKLTPKIFNFTFNFIFMNYQDEITLMYSITDLKALPKTRFFLHELGTLQFFIWSESRWVGIPFTFEHCDKYLFCGPNGYCDPSNVDKFVCMCLPGFEPKSPRDWYLRDGSHGCMRKQGVSTCNTGEGFVKLAHVKVPDTSEALVNMSLSLEECEQECLRNCSCTAYSSTYEGEGIGCLRWHGELVDTRTFPNVGQDLYIRVDAVVLGIFYSFTKLHLLVFLTSYNVFEFTKYVTLPNTCPSNNA